MPVLVTAKKGGVQIDGKGKIYPTRAAALVAMKPKQK